MAENSDNHNIKSIQVLLDKTSSSDALVSLFNQHDIDVLLLESYTDFAPESHHKAIDALILGSELTKTFAQAIADDIPVIISMLDNSKPLSQDILGNIEAFVPCDPLSIVIQTKKVIEKSHQTSQLQDGIDRLENDVVMRKRKMLEIELLKNAIVRNVSHELRTPLLQVKSAVALIGEDQTDKKLINYAQNAVSRLEIHVKNITMLGHSLETNLSPIILRDAVEYAKRNLTRVWTRRTDAERININMAPSLPAVMADKQGLSTVLQLLIDNALKFGKDNEIEIIGRKSSDDKVYIAVRDQGIGIAEDKLQVIFESFYQVDDTSTRPYGGAGVGLALVKLILENHGTNISVDSELNKGSTFWFELQIVNFDDIT